MFKTFLTFAASNISPYITAIKIAAITLLVTYLVGVSWYAHSLKADLETMTTAKVQVEANLATTQLELIRIKQDSVTSKAEAHRIETLLTQQLIEADKKVESLRYEAMNTAKEWSAITNRNCNSPEIRNALRNYLTKRLSKK